MACSQERLRGEGQQQEKAVLARQRGASAASSRATATDQGLSLLLQTTVQHTQQLYIGSNAARWISL